jgi:uncharacterized membrane protein YhaH (DUF805 family)
MKEVRVRRSSIFIGISLCAAAALALPLTGLSAAPMAEAVPSTESQPLSGLKPLDPSRVQTGLPLAEVSSQQTAPSGTVIFDPVALSGGLGDANRLKYEPSDWLIWTAGFGMALLLCIFARRGRQKITWSSRGAPQPPLKDLVRQYVSCAFKGRTGRKGIQVALGLWSLSMLLTIAFPAFVTGLDDPAAAAFLLIIGGILTVPWIAAQVRRLHDSDLSGWWLFIHPFFVFCVAAVAVQELGNGLSNQPAEVLALGDIVITAGSCFFLCFLFVSPGTEGANRFEVGLDGQSQPDKQGEVTPEATAIPILRSIAGNPIWLVGILAAGALLGFAAAKSLRSYSSFNECVLRESAGATLPQQYFVARRYCSEAFPNAY